MPIDFIDGFEDYPAITTQGVGFTSNWLTTGTSGTTLVAGRVGGQAVRFTVYFAERFVTPSFECSLFMAFKPEFSQNLQDQYVCKLMNAAGASQVEIMFNSLGEMIVRCAGVETARFPGFFQHNTWASLSIVVKSHDTAGIVQIRKNGELLCNLANVKTQTAATPIARFMLNGARIGATAPSATFDDVRFDHTTLVPIPEGRFAVTEFLADDAVQFTRLSGATNFGMIDDPTCDQDVTYNSSNTVGHRDIFTLKPLDFNPDRIMAVVVTTIARKEDVATRRIKSLLISGATEVDGVDQYLTTNYTIKPMIFETDPATGLEFTKSGLTALKPGYELVE